MSYIKGKDVILMVQGGTGYVPWMCAISIAISTTVETKEIMTVGDGHWRKPKAQKLSYSIELAGVTPYPVDNPAEFGTFNLIDHQIGFTNIEYKLFFKDDSSSTLKMYVGEAMIVDSNILAGAENVMDSTFTLDGFGAYEIFNTDSACSATLGTFAYASQGIASVNFNYTGLSGGTRLVYSVDGSTKRTLIGQDADGSIVVFNGVGIQDGDHAIVLWAVCDNGELGESLTVNYTKT